MLEVLTLSAGLQGVRRFCLGGKATSMRCPPFATLAANVKFPAFLVVWPLPMSKLSVDTLNSIPACKHCMLQTIDKSVDK